jgi:hypothetical protein
MEILTEAQARSLLLKAVAGMNYELVAHAYSALLTEKSVCVSADGDPHVRSGIYSRGAYIRECAEDSCKGN